MKITAISGYAVKGPACFLVELSGRRLLLDLGEGPEPGVRPDLSGLDKVDAILLSHGHADHTRALDLAARLGSPMIYCTPVVAELVDVKRFGQVTDLPYAGPTSVYGIELLLGHAGHAPGAVWIRIGGSNGLLYTGDVGGESPLFPSSELPPAAGLIIDSSYGIYDDPLEMGIDDIRSRAAAGPVLLPAPADGRGLEMAVVLHESGYRVSLCPAHLKVAEHLFGDPSLLRSGSAGRLRAMLDASAPLTENSSPSGVMIASGGDGQSGLARSLIDRWVERLDVQLIFTGHLAAGSAGRALVDKGRASFVRWNVHPTFSHLQKMIEQSAAGQILPAFLAKDKLSSLALKLQLGGRLVSGSSFTLGANVDPFH